MRDINDFVASEDYYDVLFHELAHSTGHASRLNRKEIANHTKFGSEQYSIEELTAEMTSCFLKSHAGIPESTLENSVSYIQGWLKVLKSDRKFIVYAAAQAQRAADFILNLSDSRKVYIA
jgi:antirestriction protein ArdC